MIQFRHFFAAIVVAIAVSASVQAQTAANGVLAGWDFHTLTNGVNNFGPSPMAPTTHATNLTATGLLRGSGVGTTGTGPNHGWGGNNLTSVDYPSATNAGQFFSFSFAVTNGFRVSFTNLSELDYRRSGTGPPNGVLEFQLGNGPFTTITNLNYTVNGLSLGSVGAVDLSGIAALQNVLPGTNVTFRVVSWGAASGAGSFLFYDVSNSAALDVIMLGTVQPFLPFQAAYDDGPGFFSGENLILTNVSGAGLSVWSSPDPSVSVTNWTLEGVMSEQVYNNNRGQSLYSINVNPATSPVYYIFAHTNAPPYSATEAVSWLTTTDYMNFNLTTTNMAISAAGVFAFPTVPVIQTPPVGTNSFVGNNAGMSVTATGGSLNYQWLHNGITLAGMQTNSLNFSPVAAGDAGNYAVIVTNFLGSITSSAAVLNVVPLPPLACYNAAGSLILAADGGAVGNRFIVLTTTNLMSSAAWIPVQTNIIGTNGQIRFTDANPTDSLRFYRLEFP